MISFTVHTPSDSLRKAIDALTASSMDPGVILMAHRLETQLASHDPKESKRAAKLLRMLYITFLELEGGCVNEKGDHP